MALTNDQLEKLTRLKHLQSVAARTKTITDDLQRQINTINDDFLKGVKVNGTALTPTGNIVDVLMTMEKKTTADTGYAASYVFKANGVAVGDTINIPKDWLLTAVDKGTVTASDKEEGGKFEHDPDFAVGDKYIDFSFNVKAGDSETTTHLYFNVQDLVDVYLAGNGLQLDASTNTFSIKLDSSYLNGLKVGANGLGLDLAAAASTTYVAATGTYVSGTTYYTDNTGTTEVDTTGFEEGVTDVSSYYVANTTPAANGAMSGADKSKLDGIAAQATKAEVTTEKAGTITINGVSKTIVDIATDAEVSEMLDAALPAPTSASSGT